MKTKSTILLLSSAAFVSGANDQCTLYLAKSTIENAGLGVFTGIPLEEEQHILFGDPTIPIVDIDFHAGGLSTKEDFHWLISEYVWKAHETGPDMDLEAETTSAFVVGLGSMPNCHFRLRNVAETHNAHDALTKRTDIGVGAFTPYHNRSTYALAAVEAGSELFVDYGIQWFLSRENEMGLIPLLDSYPKATRFLEATKNLVENISTLLEGQSDEEVSGTSLFEGAMSDLWEIIKQSPYKSRPLSAIPNSYSVAKRAFEVGIEQTELEQSIRSLDYLKNHGKCLDNIRPGNSTIPQAGRGAFATRFLQKDSYVSIAPLIHIPDRDVLTMYAEKYDDEETRDTSQPVGNQLLLNYCFGHTSSSLLLCPYGPGVALINHNSKSPNAKVVWSGDPVYHNSKWLDEPVAFFDNVWNTGLSFEYIATRDIAEGDEITIDYGPEWEDAWTKHKQEWEPPVGAESYISPQELNGNYSIPIPTHDEDSTLFEEIFIWCRFSSYSIKEDSHVWQPRDMVVEEHAVERIIGRTQLPSDESQYIYTLVIVVETQDTEHDDRELLYIVKNVPRKALFFEQQRYRSDLFVEGIFRHEIMIPNDIFPDSWKNIVE